MQVFYTEGGECWNALPGEVVGAGMIAAFKGQLDKYMYRMGMEGYGLRKCIRF